MSFVPTIPQLFFSKNDPLDIRLGEIFKPYKYQTLNTLTTSSTADHSIILGYPDDEGIKLNGGRPGANEGPKIIRQFLYKMTWPHKELNKAIYADIGDLDLKESLAERHKAALNHLTHFHQNNFRILSFGGGHDYGYPDAAAFLTTHLSQNPTCRPLVINFDAHLDVRPTHAGFNSGTPFYRLLTEFENRFDFVEIGIQPQCNSIHHKDWALNKNAFIFEAFQTYQSLDSLKNEKPFKTLNKTTPVFISFDIDCLSSSVAGGCSQSWATGLDFYECLKFLNWIYNQSQCKGLGIYEVSPPLDTDHRTSKSAALLAYHFLFPNQLKTGF